MYRPPPTSLLEALQQMMGGQQQNDLSSLFGAPMMPQETPVNPMPENPFPQYDYGNMGLSPLEQQLSQAMTNKGNFEDAAMQEGRGDLFANAAMNDPERAPFHMAKSELAETKRREGLEAERFQQEQGALQNQQHLELEARLLPEVGPELASVMARRLMSGESPTPEEMTAWQQAKFQKEAQAFEQQKREYVTEQMAKGTVAVKDPKTGEYKYDMDNKIQVIPLSMADDATRAEARMRFESDFGAGPQAPTMPVVAEQAPISKQIDPKTGKTMFRNAPVAPSATSPRPTTGTTTEGPPKPQPAPTKRAKQVAEKETFGGAIGRTLTTAAQGAWNESPFAKIAQLLKTPSEDVGAGQILGTLGRIMPPVAAGTMLAGGGGGLGEEFIASMSAGPQRGGLPTQGIDAKKMIDPLIAKKVPIERIQQEVMNDKNLDDSTKSQLLAYLRTLQNGAL